MEERSHVSRRSVVDCWNIPFDNVNDTGRMSAERTPRRTPDLRSYDDTSSNQTPINNNQSSESRRLSGQSNRGELSNRTPHQYDGMSSNHGSGSNKISISPFEQSMASK